MSTERPADGLLTIASRHTVKDTIDRLEAELRARGITVFARIDHAAGADSVGMPLQPTEVLIFGNPKAGTPLMQDAQSIGIDLPLKVLAWEDASGRVMLSYNDVRWLARRHHLGNGVEPQVAALTGLLTKLAEAAAA
ncbi:MAG: DUF302 domain-containing protein [Nevskia sp.]|nr:DUF302 domain-containing protein [Nevskia sp.]